MQRKILTISAFFLIAGLLKAQDTSAISARVSELSDALSSTNETIAEMKSTLDALKKIKLSGYIQAQFQATNGSGGWNGSSTSAPTAVGSYSGGAFPKDVSSRFSVRRGRLKATYDNELTQYVIQIDVTQSGVSIKDAYVKLTEPWKKWISLTAGVFDRPFGFEISYSSSNRESPERSRMFQILFPGERDLGMKIEINPTTGTLSVFNLKAGLFNGTGIANEVDNKKDFIGRLGVSLPFDDINLAIDGGFSLYSGAVRSNSKYIYSKIFNVDSSTSNIGKYFDRTYYGLDVQLYYDIPVIGGFSIRGEVIKGQQPGTQASSSFYNPGTTSTPLFKRNFLGYYLCYVQNIGLKNQFVLKYDVYEPNIDGSSKNIGVSGNYMGLGDIKFTTLGVGWIYHWDANIKFTTYYEIVTNDEVNQGTTSTTFAPYKTDIKDNVFTFRIQYKF